MEDGLRIGNDGIVIERCMDKLVEFCANDAYPYYDVVGRKFAHEPHVLQPELLTAVNSAMRARSSRSAWGPFLGIEVTELKAIPTDVDLVTSDDGVYADARQHLERCYRLLTDKRGIGDVAASKMLFLKRPELVAISDIYVREALGIAEPDQRQLRSARDSYVVKAVAVIDGIRRVGRANLQLLDVLQAALQSEYGIIVSRCRIIDMLIWIDMAIPHHSRWKWIAKERGYPSIAAAISARNSESSR